MIEISCSVELLWPAWILKDIGAFTVFGRSTGQRKISDMLFAMKFYFFFFALFEPFETCESGLFFSLSSDPSFECGLVLGVFGVFGVTGLESVLLFSFSSGFLSLVPASSCSVSATFFSSVRSFSSTRFSSASAFDALSSAAWALSSVDL